MFQADQYLFPLFSAKLVSGSARVQRFLGCGFWLDEHGHFATCKHVLDSVAEGETLTIGQPNGPQSDHFWPVLSSTPHPQFDVAVCRASASAVGAVLYHYEDPISLGLEVQAFGYTDGGRHGARHQVDPRLLCGHVSRFAFEPYGLPSPTLLEVSFGSPSGFSGTPLLVGSQAVGILYSNLDSRLQAYAIEESSTGASQYREIAYRIYEYGIAHSIADLQPFFAQCGVGQS